MAIAVHRSQHRIVHRPTWVRRRGAEPDTVLAGLMLMLLLGGVTVLIATFDLASSAVPTTARSWFPRTASPRPADGAAATQPVVTEVQSAAPSAPAAASATEPATPLQAPTEPSGVAVGASARIAHTDGLGVVLHTAPAKNARVPAGLLEGVRVTVLETAGPDWARVETETKRTGWVPTAFLTLNE